VRFGRPPLGCAGLAAPAHDSFGSGLLPASQGDDPVGNSPGRMLWLLAEHIVVQGRTCGPSPPRPLERMVMAAGRRGSH